MKRAQLGFSLTELLVVISIFAILLTVVITGMQDARTQSRDAQRQTDMQTLSAALELYKQKYGQYPAGCNGATTGTTPNWSGQKGSDYECTSGGEYIVGLTPEFMQSLPRDPRLNGDDSGYVYTTNSELSVYKLMALNTVEVEVVSEGHQFFRCGSEYRSGVLSCLDDSSISACRNSEDAELCERTPTSITNTSYRNVTDQNLLCEEAFYYESTYAVSGGFSSDSRGNSSNPSVGEEFDTEIVRCS